jgi:DNA topoisomerase-1
LAGELALAGGEPRQSARDAGLRYGTDSAPGIRRVRRGRGFVYFDRDGGQIRDESTLARVRTLAIPPAWTDVWICPMEDGHLQATGRDARGRKQYRYHALWRARRDEVKFERLIAFAEALPRIRRRTNRDLARPGLPREKVLAGIVRLLELTLIRVGNEEYARLNRSFGLTTMRDRHAHATRTGVRFRFRGKSGQLHEVGIRDRRLARLIRRCQELPGQELFQYVDEDGEVGDIRSEDVNGYLRDAAGADVTAKDFRTWAGTVSAYRALRGEEPPATTRAARKTIVRAMRETAERLGNTPAVARQAYVHPAVIEAYANGAAKHGPGAPAGSSETEQIIELLKGASWQRSKRGAPTDGRSRRRTRAGSRSGAR